MSRMPAYTVWPASARCRADMAPKPLDAPVMTTTLPMTRPPACWWSERLDEAPVDPQDLAVHPGAVGTREEGDHSDDVFWTGQPFERCQVGELVDLRLALSIEEQVGRHRSGRHGVHGDLPAAQLVGQRVNE